MGTASKVNNTTPGSRGNITAADIAQALEKPFPRSDGWIACCPAHEDHNPSLSIRDVGGRVLVYCHGGCSQERVISVLEQRGLWPGPRPEREAAQDWQVPETSQCNGAGASVAGVREKIAKARSTAVTPVPDGAPEPPVAHRVLGRPTATWPYRDARGRLLGYVLRFETKSAKEMRPLTYRRNTEGDELWEWKGFASPRPLYGLDRLAACPDLPVIVCEGEKAADAAQEILGAEYVCVTWPGGSAGVKHADWAPLNGRTVHVWPDNDTPGRKAAQAVKGQIQGAKILQVPEDKPSGWDAADALSEGITADAVTGWIVTGENTPPQEEGTVCVRLSDVQPKAVDWLWWRRFGRGKVSLIAGNPGLGKSQITASLAAITTTGGVWPVDRTQCRVGNVVFLSAEDDAADTIVPRLKAAGADLSRIHKIEAMREYTADGESLRSPSLIDDMPRLSQTLRRIGGADLVVIDPVTAFLGSGRVDSHNNSDIRGVMLSLQEFAERNHTAVIGVSHLSKGSQSQALMAVMGSLGWVAAARAAYGVFADDDPNSRRRLMLPLKNNLGDDENGLSFEIESVDLEDGISTSRIRWDTEPITKSADEIYADDDTGKSATDEAVEFLQDALERGPRPVPEVKEEAKKADITAKALRRGREKLGIRATRERFDGQWTWDLPRRAPDTPARHDGQDGQDGQDGEDRAEKEANGSSHLAHLAHDARLDGEGSGGQDGAVDPLRRHREYIDRALAGTPVTVDQLRAELSADDIADFEADDPPPVEALRAMAERLNQGVST